MRKLIGSGALGLAALAVLLALTARHPQVQAQEKGKKMLAHMVYFSLKDNSAAAKQKLVDACHKHLKGHEGEAFFAAGTLVEELKRDVNDRDFDVALHIVFRDMKAHDAYQTHPRHDEFIKENKDNWKKVRVFDSYVN